MADSMLKKSILPFPLSHLQNVFPQPDSHSLASFNSDIALLPFIIVSFRTGRTDQF
ncbi:hypothetical protein ES332_D03G133600v1 [Gossypium tomentosum]|uniref:Uncharacterized protein n=1 Tax=Gossypium tomentosum TaxID=34277 RepID=A0A5D2LM73_GOSTO|nr:hypothetical protein ES332_D03G133600v1 [Gossypium tomentosum]